jgi:hypothetical protein
LATNHYPGDMHQDQRRQRDRTSRVRCNVGPGACRPDNITRPNTAHSPGSCTLQLSGKLPLQGHRRSWRHASTGSQRLPVHLGPQRSAAVRALEIDKPVVAGNAPERVTFRLTEPEPCYPRPAAQAVGCLSRENGRCLATHRDPGDRRQNQRRHRSGATAGLSSSASLGKHFPTSLRPQADL